jgi:protein MpaA
MKFEKIQSAISTNGNEIKAYKSEGHTSAKYTYILGAVHGDEVEGAHLAKNLFEWLQHENSIDMSMIIVPIVNIDGFINNSRVNANGVDLNRNLPSQAWKPEYAEAKYFPGTAPLSEIENKFLVELFKNYPPRFILSFHSWYPVLNYNGECREIAEFLASYNKYDIAADFEDHPTPGSLGEYGPQFHNSPVLTFECPLLSETVTLETIWNDNKEALTKLFTTNLINNFKF